MEKIIDLAKLRLATGQSITEPTGIDPGSPWKKIERNCDLLLEYMESAEDCVKNFNGDKFSAQALGQLAQELRRKPNIVILGKFDSGKSRLANGLLGRRSLPDKYQPATRLITYVCHIKDRPSWLKEEVLILKKEFDFVKDIPQFDSLKIERLIKEWKIVAGNLEILGEYVTRDGRYAGVKEAKYALVYMESPLLQTCNLVDLPGYGDSEGEDSERVEQGAKLADILIYTSNSTGFLDAEDFARMSYALTRLPSFEGTIKDFPPLGNLFIVATHASPDKSRKDLEDILSKASKRLYDTLSEIWKELERTRGTPINADTIHSRMFTYRAENPQRREKLEKSLTNLLKETLPRSKYVILDWTLTEYKTSADIELSAIIRQYQSLVENITCAEETYEALLKNEPARKERVAKEKAGILRSIQKYKEEHLAELEDAYTKDMNIEELEKIIRAKYNRKNDAQRSLSIYLLDRIQGRLGRAGEQKAKLLKFEIDGFLRTYDLFLSPLSNDVKKPTLTIPFDAKGAFLGGLSGLTAIGALTWWVSTLGNLGGYILAAKLTGWLATIGISVGGGAAMVSFLAAIGGPITVGIAIALVVATLVWSIFGDSWQERLAKKTVQTFDTKKIKETLAEGIVKFWNVTEESFIRGAENVENKFNESFSNLREIANGKTSREELERRIAEFRKVKDFLAGTPWVPLAR